MCSSIRSSLTARLCSIRYCIIGIIMLCCSLAQELKGMDFKVSCNYVNFTTTIIFQNAFKGVIFTEGNYFNPGCKFLAPDTGTKNASFLLPLTDCGNHVREIDGGFYVSNNIVIQKYPNVETGWDIVHKSSCKLPSPDLMHMQQFIHESHPSHVWSTELEAYMEFQVRGKRLGVDVSNKLMVGDEFMIVVHVKDGGRHKDFQVENCWAYEGESIPTSQYVLKIHDMFKCQNDWISDIDFSRRVENKSTSVVFGHIKAFKFISSRNLHLTCTIEACTEACYRYCDSESERSNYFTRNKRSADTADKSLRLRHRLMKATIKALGTKLMERNRKALSANDSNFNRRSTNSTLTTLKSYGDIEDPADLNEYYNSTVFPNEIYNFNVTNNVIVFKREEFNFKRDYCNSSRIVATDCVPKLRFGIVTASLSFIILCLIFICMGCMLHIRKEKKKNHIDGFLLYNLY